MGVKLNGTTKTTKTTKTSKTTKTAKPKAVKETPDWIIQRGIRKGANRQLAAYLREKGVKELNHDVWSDAVDVLIETGDVKKAYQAYKKAAA